MRKLFNLAAACAVGLGASQAAFAVTPIDFSGSAVVSANSADPGLLINVLNLSSLNFSLTDVGSTATIASLFTLWTPEADVGSDDKASKPITVSFDLTPVVTGMATGATVGQASGLFGAIQNGRLTWSQNEFELSYGTDGLIGVSLTGGIFNTGLFGLGHLPVEGLNVGATFRLIQLATPVLREEASAAPEPATWATIIVGFGAIGAGLRRRRTVRVAYAG